MLVKPEVAAAQFAAEAAASVPAPVGTTMAYSGPPSIPGAAVSERSGTGTLEPSPLLAPPPTPTISPGQSAPPVVAVPKFHRFYGSVKINARTMAGDAGKIMEEVVQHLTRRLGANVQVTLEIQAHIPDGVPDEKVRTVTENCRTLRFEGFGFEEE